MSSETPLIVTDAPALVDTVMAPPPAEETPVTAAENNEGDKPNEEAAELTDEKAAEKEKDKEVKAPSRRSTRISAKPQAAEVKETPKPKRAPSAKKRAAEEGNDEGKTNKKAS